MEAESSYDADELGQFQSLSSLAVMALVLGVLSPIAFFSPLLVVVPGFALAVAIAALARIKSSEGGLLGTRLAYCGLALAIVFGVAAITRTQVRVEILRRQANETAERWLSMLANGRAEEALGLMTSSAISKLIASGEDGATVPIFEAELRSAQLLRDPLAVALIEMHQTDKKTLPQYQGTRVQDLPQPRVMFYFKFPNFQTHDSLFLLSLVKTEENYGPAVWLVEAWKTQGVTFP